MEKTDKKTQRIIVYGTLKKDQYNYKYIKQMCGEDSLVKKEDLVLDGFEMYDLGSYPGIVQAENGQIVCEVMEASPKAANFIQMMEQSSGYREAIIDNARIYIYARPIKSYNKIETGEWL